MTNDAWKYWPFVSKYFSIFIQVSYPFIVEKFAVHSEFKFYMDTGIWNILPLYGLYLNFHVSLRCQRFLNVGNKVWFIILFFLDFMLFVS